MEQNKKINLSKNILLFGFFIFPIVNIILSVITKKTSLSHIITQLFVIGMIYVCYKGFSFAKWFLGIMFILAGIFAQLASIYVLPKAVYAGLFLLFYGFWLYGFGIFMLVSKNLKLFFEISKSKFNKKSGK